MENKIKYSNKIINILLILNSLIYLFTAGFGVFSAVNQRTLILALLLPVIFIKSNLDINYDSNYSKFKYYINILLGFLVFIVNLYMMFIWKDRAMNVTGFNIEDIIMGTLTILILLEATRKSCGASLPIIAIIFIIYALYGPYFPSIIAHRGETWSRLVSFLYLTTEGIYGTAMGVASTYIIVFVIFGAFLEKFGGGEWFINMAYSITGKFRGGPAKTAVLGSALMGMISGAPAANVATTGSFTIPLMKKTGYSAEEAGAIEAVASTGGIFTPPLMGAAAFVMAEYLQVPYSTIAKSAIVPAFLYYFTLMLVVDARAVKKGLIGLDPTTLPKFSYVMKTQGILSIPLLSIIILIIIGWSPMKAAFFSTILTIITAFFTKDNKPNINKVIEALKNGSKGCISIVAACATAGIIVGVISMTGLGAKLSYTLIGLARGNVLIAGVLCALIALVLGCGMPPTAVYIILASILAPSLVELGAHPIAAHLFIFMFAAVGALTPPVAITAYTGAAIAEGDPNKTGALAFRFGLTAYIIPFMFLISPEVILLGDTNLIIKNVLTLTIGIISLVISTEGFFIKTFGKISRIFFALASIGLIIPGTYTDSVGLLLITLGIATEMFWRKNN